MNPWVKINKYFDLLEILQYVLEHWVWENFWYRNWIYKQNSSPDYKAKVMQGCLVANFLGFSVPQKWLPYTPGLNPWIYLFGQFWRQRSLLNNPKV